MNYLQRFTWQHFYDDTVLMHSDGACSVLLCWPGMDADLLGEDEARARYRILHRLIDHLPTEITAEWHLWRERSADLAKAYYGRVRDFVRAQEVGAAFRESMASHLAQFAVHNEVGLVLTWHQGANPLFPKRALIGRARHAEKLLEHARKFIEQLPGARIAGQDEFFGRLAQSFDRSAWDAGRRPGYRSDYFINEQIVTGMPVLESGMLRLGDRFTKVLLLYLYPDAVPGLAAVLSDLPIEMHFSYIVRRIDVKRAMRASEKAEHFSAGTATRTGTEHKQLKVGDEAGFRQTVIANNYQVFANTYIVHLHGADPAQLRRAADDFANVVENQLGGQVRMHDDVQLLFWRHGQPAQGYRASWSRRDHTQQVGDMLPVQVFGTGDREPQMLRLGRGNQLVGMTYDPDLVNHSFTVAMTGAGKGVNKVAQILETYPLGIDWYIMEVGTSYQWTVEALGGTYTRIDPGETVVNPLPPYKAASLVDDEGFPLLPLEMMTGTVESLAFILTDQPRLTTAQNAVAQTAFEAMYAAPEEGREQPTFETLLEILQMADDFVNNEVELEEAKQMSYRLESFLSTAEGRVFSKPNNFSLSEGITGVDLLLVRNKAKNLLKFYLVFLSLAFTQRAFSSQHRARVLLDEMHVYVQTAPDVIGPLITGLSRMGRKDGASLDLVTQETDEIDMIERAVINQCPWQTFLYRQADWDLIAQRTNMPAPVVARWRAYENPLGLPYRPAIQRVGDRFYDLYLTFPEDVLLLASSDKSDLDAKAQIGAQTPDPFERIRLLKAHKEARHAEAAA